MNSKNRLVFLSLIRNNIQPYFQLFSTFYNLCRRQEVYQGNGGYVLKRRDMQLWQCVAGCRTTAQCPQGQGCLNNKCTTMICSPGYSRSCYEGETGKSVGICREGIQICLSDGRTFSPCYNPGAPATRNL